MEFNTEENQPLKFVCTRRTLVNIILESTLSNLDEKSKEVELFLIENTGSRVNDDSEINYMSTTVHKILIHGHDVISKSLLPIGQLSEEALEARNKDFKDYRQYFSRETSRKDTITDIFNRMLVSSDPLLMSLQSPSLKKKRFNFHKDAIEMFKNVSLEEERSQQS